MVTPPPTADEPATGAPSTTPLSGALVEVRGHMAALDGRASLSGVLAARPRSQDTLDEATRAASLLCGGEQPGTCESREAVVRREVRHFYAPGVVMERVDQGPIYTYLDQVVHNGGPLFFRGVCLGVGASTLLTDYIAAFNANALVAGLPSIGCVDVAGHCPTGKQLLDAMATELRIPLPAAILRQRSTRTVVQRLVGHLLLHGVGTLVFDHIANVEGTALDFVVTLLREFTSEARRRSHSALLGGYSQKPFGVVLADHQAPEFIFRKHPSILVALKGSIVTLDRYRNVEDMAAALDQAALTLGPVDPSDTADQDALQLLLKMTHGLPIYMNRAFELLDLLSARYPQHDLLTLVHALPLHLRMQVNMREDLLEDGTTVTALFPRRLKRVEQDTPATDVPSQELTSGGRGRRPRKSRLTAAERIQEKKKVKAVAQRDHAALHRKSHATLPAG